MNTYKNKLPIQVACMYWNVQTVIRINPNGYDLKTKEYSIKGAYVNAKKFSEAIEIISDFEQNKTNKDKILFDEEIENLINANLAPPLTNEDLKPEIMKKIKVLNHLNKYIFLEVNEDMYKEIQDLVIKKYCSKPDQLELLYTLKVDKDILMNSFDLITEDIVNEAMKNLIKK